MKLEFELLSTEQNVDFFFQKKESAKSSCSEQPVDVPLIGGEVTVTTQQQQTPDKLLLAYGIHCARRRRHLEEIVSEVGAAKLIKSSRPAHPVVIAGAAAASPPQQYRPTKVCRCDTNFKF